MQLSDIHDILFCGFWCGGGGEDGNPKIRKGKSEPVSFEYAIQNYTYLLGKIKGNIVLEDFDSDDAFWCRLNIVKSRQEHCIAIKSPHKGGHIYWFNNNRSVVISNSGNKTVMTLSPVDYKCGIKIVKSTGEVKPGDSYGSISNDDKSLREIVYCNIHEDRTLDEIPFYDLPIKSGYKHEFLNMGEGDGRQDGLFTYMNPMKSAGYSYEQFVEVADVINTYLFKKPLTDEFDNAIRKEAWDSIEGNLCSKFFKGNTFLHDKFAEHIRRTYNIKKVNGQLHIYKYGIYISGSNEIKKAMLKEISSLTDAKRTEVLKQLDLICDEFSIDERMADLIAFRNGVLNLKSKNDQVQPFSPDNIITNKIPWDYNPKAYSEIADKTLDKIACHDANIRFLLEECIGSCFYRSNTLGGGKCFILTGEGSNGKSTFIEVIQVILGEDNYSVIDFKNLITRFQNADLIDKLANLGDDISDEFNSDVSVFKKIVTGNEIQVEKKGQDPINFKPYCTLVFSANNMPRIKDKTGAAQRRLLIVPFDAKFSKTDADYDNTIIWKLKEQESIEYFIKVGVQGLQRVLLNRDYTSSAKVTEQLEEYKIANNPVLSFLQYCKDEDIPIENEAVETVFNNYQGYCIKNGFQALASNEFSKQLQRNTGLISKRQTVNKKKYRIFIKDTGQA